MTGARARERCGRAPLGARPARRTGPAGGQPAPVVRRGPGGPAVRAASNTRPLAAPPQLGAPRQPERAWDDAILGGGLAGLSLAVSLADADPRRRILVIEPRTEYERDRTWCYWDASRHPFEAQVAHSWHSWKLRFDGRERLHRSDRYRYCELPADAFYRAAVDRLAKAPGVELRLGTSATALEESNRGVRVSTHAGDIVAGRAFDGRPRAAASLPAPLHQHFVGLRVRVAPGAFDPRAVTLMDFDVEQKDGIQFMYVLPFADDEALVEATFLSPSPFAEEHYLASIERYLRERLGVLRFRELERERGAIPLCAQRLPLRTGRRTYRIGAAGGLVKPSTGYAFLAIQRFTRTFGERLVETDLPAPPEARGRVSHALDSIFLSYLRRHPERAPAIFARLFDRVAPDTLVRFLSDTGGARERVAVLSAMPKLPFLQEAWHARGDWLS